MFYRRRHVVPKSPSSYRIPQQGVTGKDRLEITTDRNTFLVTRASEPYLGYTRSPRQMRRNGKTVRRSVSIKICNTHCAWLTRMTLLVAAARRIVTLVGRTPAGWGAGTSAATTRRRWASFVRRTAMTVHVRVIITAWRRSTRIVRVCVIARTRSAKFVSETSTRGEECPYLSRLS